MDLFLGFDGHLARLQAEARRREAEGATGSTLVTAFPKNEPSAGIEYSRNFQRCQRHGQFALQVRD